MGIFSAAHGWWWWWGGGGGGGGGRPPQKRPPLPKICDTYPAMMKLGTVIPDLEKIQKIYESRDTQHFFYGNQQTLLYQKIDIDCILMHNF